MLPNTAVPDPASPASPDASRLGHIVREARLWMPRGTPEVWSRQRRLPPLSFQRSWFRPCSRSRTLPPFYVHVRDAGSAVPSGSKCRSDAVERWTSLSSERCEHTPAHAVQGSSRSPELLSFVCVKPSGSCHSCGVSVPRERPKAGAVCACPQTLRNRVSALFPQRPNGA